MSKVIDQSTTDNEWYFAQFAHRSTTTGQEPYWMIVENASGLTRFSSYAEVLKAAKWCVENIPNGWATCTRHMSI